MYKPPVRQCINLQYIHVQTSSTSVYEPPVQSMYKPPVRHCINLQYIHV